MNGQILLLVGAALIVAYGVSYSVTPLTSRLAKRLGVLDRPDEAVSGYKQHREPIPYLGGVAIFVGTMAGAAFLLISTQDQLERSQPRYSFALLMALSLGLMGLADDVKPMSRSLRLVIQIATAYGAWQAGFQVHAFDAQLLNLAITILWIVGITNAFNLMDNMDGLLAGLAGICALSFGVMGILGNLAPLTILAASLCGAAFGFLAHNRHPARVFMGDAGSLFLGYLLALIGLQLEFDNLVRVTFFIPVIVLVLPIIDTTLVTISRMHHKRPVFLGGRDHMSHRLVRVGLPVKTTVRLLYWSGLCLGWLGLVISRSTPQVGYMLLGFVVALGLFFGYLLFQVPVYADDVEEAAELEEQQEESKVAYLEQRTEKTI